MKRTFYIAGKELLQIRRDRLAALFTIVVPVVFTLFLGLITGSMGASSRLPLAIADNDHTAASQQLVASLNKQQAIKTQTMTASSIETSVQDQKIAGGLIIPAGYGSSLAGGKPASLTLVRIQTSSGAQSVVETVQSVVVQTNATIIAASSAAEQVSAQTGRTADGSLLQKATGIAQSQVSAPSVTVAMVASNTNASRKITGFEQASSGEMLNFVLFALLTTAIGLVLERRTGLIKRLTAAGVRRSEIFGGKLLAMISIAFLQQLFLVLLGQLAFGVNYFNSPLALVVVIFSTSVLAASMGLLIASLFKSQQAVIATTVISAMPYLFRIALVIHA